MHKRKQVTPPLGVLCFTDQSLIPGVGLGLFAKERIARNTRITYYDGDLVSREVAIKHPNPSHLMSVSHSVIIDGLRAPQPDRGGASFANHSKHGHNTKLKRVQEGECDERCVLVSVRDIEKGEELLYSYGRHYWIRQREVAIVQQGFESLCYCLKPDDYEMYIECSGKKQCLFGGWIHLACATGEQHVDLSKPFICRWCVNVV